MYTDKTYGEKSIPMIGVQHLDFLLPEVKQPIILTILIIYSPYFLKDLVEL